MDCLLAGRFTSIPNRGGPRAFNKLPARSREKGVADPAMKVIKIDRQNSRKGGWHQQLREGRISEEIDQFLWQMRLKLETNILDENGPGVKASLGDYLKLIAVIEERLQQQAPQHKEIVVRWEDPDEGNNFGS